MTSVTPSRNAVPLEPRKAFSLNGMDRGDVVAVSGVFVATMGSVYVTVAGSSWQNYALFQNWLCFPLGKTAVTL